MIKYFFLYMFLLVGFGAKIQAHEIRPAYLLIKQTNENSYDLIWKVPRKGDMVISLYPVFADGFKMVEAGERKIAENSMVFHYNLQGKTPLPNSKFSIHNLEKTMVDVLVDINYLNGERTTIMLKPDQPTATVPGKTSKWNVTKTYLGLGIEHIVLGVDHLLFVLALIIITKGWKKILKTVTAFTLAHSITLSLAALGYVNFPAPPVEAIIALSIIFLALEILKNIRGEQTLTSRQPWLVAFVFGLLHGLGFAGALSQIGLPQTEIPLALAFFNIGVELGQLAFVLLVLLIIRIVSLKKDWPLVLQKVPAYTIGCIASFWLIERVLTFFQ